MQRSEIREWRDLQIPHSAMLHAAYFVQIVELAEFVVRESISGIKRAKINTSSHQEISGLTTERAL
ncbi:hypothetical protein [Methylomarinum vadi]|uniref:hypothetical protein n=1 Tax=Methylomarinum vadi TaxID=438855 RepID=UPI0004DF0A33|nr:hypothetical protein [Methylomarinum vadi]